MIELKNISKTYNKKENKILALREISLTVNDGEAVAIVGTSGSGKTTLLNILGGMDAADEGEYFYNGEKVHTLHGKKLDEFRKQKIGFVFQQFALLPDYTVLENIELPLRARNIGRKQRKEMVMEWLEKVKMEQYAACMPKKLSGGQQQRCAIVRALITGAPVLLADEPTGALDSKTGQEIIDLLLSLNAMRTTLLLVTHDEKIAARMGRVIRIEDGMIKSEIN